MSLLTFVRNRHWSRDYPIENVTVAKCQILRLRFFFFFVFLTFGITEAAGKLSASFSGSFGSKPKAHIFKCAGNLLVVSIGHGLDGPKKRLFDAILLALFLIVLSSF